MPIAYKICIVHNNKLYSTVRSWGYSPYIQMSRIYTIGKETRRKKGQGPLICLAEPPSLSDIFWTLSNAPQTYAVIKVRYNLILDEQYLWSHGEKTSVPFGVYTSKIILTDKVIPLEIVETGEYR